MEERTTPLASLFDALEQQLKLLKALAESAREKIEILSRGDAQELSQLLLREEETAEALAEQERIRTQAAEALARELSLPAETVPTLSALAARLKDAPSARKLNDLGGAMEAAVKELSRLNQKARVLLGHQMKYTDFMLNLLYDVSDKAEMYNMQGSREENASQFSRLDFRA